MLQANAIERALPQRVGQEQLRVQLRALAESPRTLHRSSGRELVEQLNAFLVPAMQRVALRIGPHGAALAPNEILHTVLIELCENEGRVARLSAEADDPWAYLAVCASNWVREVCGNSYVSLEALAALPTTTAPQDPLLTPIEEVVRCAHRIVVLFAPARLRDELFAVLSWLAENPPQRVSHETGDRVAAQLQFPSFTSKQIVAVMNVAWGGRPRRAETSLFAAILLDADFRPATSPTHMRALLHFRQVMRREESHWRLLSLSAA